MFTLFEKYLNFSDATCKFARLIIKSLTCFKNFTLVTFKTCEAQYCATIVHVLSITI